MHNIPFLGREKEVGILLYLYAVQAYTMQGFHDFIMLCSRYLWCCCFSLQIKQLSEMIVQRRLTSLVMWLYLILPTSFGNSLLNKKVWASFVICVIWAINFKAVVTTKCSIIYLILNISWVYLVKLRFRLESGLRVANSLWNWNFNFHDVW